MKIKLSKKTIGIALLVLLVAVFIWWYFFKRNSSDGINADDKQAYEDMIQIFKNSGDAAALSWMMKYVNDRYNGNGFTDDYLINGKITKSGAWLQIYDQTYFGRGYKGSDTAHDQMWNVFTNLKAKMQAN